MKPPKFNYLRPSSLTQALQYLEDYGEEAKIISGGQSLIPVLNMRLSTPEYLIDLGRVEGLRYIREEGNQLVIGTMTRQIDVERSALVKERCPLLTEAVQHIGHPQIRNRGTVGGSIAHADPSAELSCVLAALRGEIVIANAEEVRIVTPEEFYLTYLLTTLEPTEMIKEVRFPCLPPTSGYTFVEISRRHGDFALVGVAAVIDLDENGRISFARLAIGGVNSVATALEDVEEFLLNKELTDEILQKACAMVGNYIEPEGDMHGSAEYRQELAVVMTRRALNKALNRAKGGAKDE